MKDKNILNVCVVVRKYLYTNTHSIIQYIPHAYYNQCRSQGGQRGQLPPLLLETRVLCTMINYSQNKLLLILFSERSVVNIDSNDFDKAGYKADILSTYLMIA